MLQLILGALGGMSPSLSKLAAVYVAFPKTDLPEPGWYFGLTLFGIIGAIVAYAFGATDAKAALAAGIAAPAIISSAVNGVQPERTVPAKIIEGPAPQRAGSFGGWFVAQARAEDRPPTSPWTFDAGEGQTGVVTMSDSRTLVIQPKVNGGLPNAAAPPLAVTATLSDGKTISLGTLNSYDRPFVFVLPKDTKTVGLNAKQAPISSDQSVIDLFVTTKPTVSGDFKWALGADRTYAITGIDAQARSVVPSLGGPELAVPTWSEKLY